MKNILKMGPVFIIMAALLWSVDGILRRALYSLPSATIVFYEHFLGAIILLPVFAKNIKDLTKMKKREWLAITLVSIFSGALGTIFYTTALGMVQYIQFSVVVLLQQLQPIWAILGIISAYLISFKDLTFNLSTGSGTITAAVLALGAGFVWAVSTSFSK